MLSRKQNNVCMNICTFPGLHKGLKSFQLYDFQGLFQHNGKQGYKQRLNYLFVVTLQCACFILLNNQGKGGGVQGLGGPPIVVTNNITKRITSNCNQDHNQKDCQQLQLKPQLGGSPIVTTNTMNINITTRKIINNCNQDHN